MPEKLFDPIKPWFDAMEDLGEYIGIRFGHIPAEAAQPEWIFRRHTECDGIGGFVELLRRHGAEFPALPQMKHPSNPSWYWFLRTIPKYLAPRKRLKWGPLPPGESVRIASQEPPKAVAWHVFDESETQQLRQACRGAGYTVNSFLLKHLTQAIRPSLEDQKAAVPWMIPVNLRGKVVRASETLNHTSYVGVKVRSQANEAEVHREIYAALAKGEHWANWYSYTAGRFLGPGMKKHLLATDKAMSEWFLGGFSNLGEWDSEKKLTQPGCRGSWLSSPPVLRFQLIGAGCVTFQNRLSLTLQAHPELTTNPAVARGWMQTWVKEIKAALARLPAPLPAAAQG